MTKTYITSGSLIMSDSENFKETEQMASKPACQSATSLHSPPDGCDARQSVSECQKPKLRSFVSAVYEKYQIGAKKNDPNVVAPAFGLVKVTDSGSVVLPKMVSMSGQEIGVAGERTFIEKMCQKVTELDLMENKLTHWEEVLTILSCSPHLTFLNLAKNRLTPPLPCVRGYNLPSLTHLVLNDTCIDWDDLHRLLDAFPRIEELFLSQNNFTAINLRTPDEVLSEGGSESCAHTYPSLQRLYFVGNKVSSFTELCKLGQFFPKLTLLMFSETDDFEGFGEVEASCFQHSFPELVTLGLNRTGLRSWEEVEKLRHFPSLTDVRLKAIPFLETLDEKFRRQYTVALLPNISLLNGSRVFESEREDAERAYIRLYMEAEEKPQRYFELEKIHGRLDQLAKVDLAERKTVRLNIKVEDEEGSTLSTQEMEFNTNQTMRQMLKLLSNVAGQPVSQLLILYVDQDNSCGERKLKSSDRKVHSFSMRNGDNIIIVKKT